MVLGHAAVVEAYVCFGFSHGLNTIIVLLEFPVGVKLGFVKLLHLFLGESRIKVLCGTHLKVFLISLRLPLWLLSPLYFAIILLCFCQLIALKSWVWSKLNFNIPCIFHILFSLIYQRLITGFLRLNCTYIALILTFKVVLNRRILISEIHRWTWQVIFHLFSLLRTVIVDSHFFVVFRVVSSELKGVLHL